MLFDGSAEMIVDSKGLPVAQYFSEENNEFAVETTDGSLVLKSDYDFRLATLIIDNKGFPIPQLWNPETEEFEVKTEQNSGGGNSGGKEESLAEKFGITGDGSIDNTRNVQEAINYLHGIGGGTLELPGGVVRMGGVTLKSKVNMIGNREKLTTILIDDMPGITMESETLMKGLVIEGDSANYFGDWNGGVRLQSGSKQVIESCVFKKLYNCIYNQNAESFEIRKCWFNCDAEYGYGLYSEISKFAVVEGCRFVCNKTESRPICFQFYAQNSLVKDNTIIGNGLAITGILFMNHYDNYNAAVYGNRVVGNYVSGVTEEGISFDMMMESDKAFDTWIGGSVSSASNNIHSNALVDNEVDLPNGVLYLRYLLITSGKGEGQIRQITGNNGGSFSIDKPWVTIPDTTSTYIVGSFGFDNVIHDNTVENCGRHGLLLYGCNLRSHITNNIVKNCGTNSDTTIYEWSGIGVVSCEANEVMRFRPAIANLVSDNTVSGGKTGIVVSSAPWSGSYQPLMLPVKTVVKGNTLHDMQKGIWFREAKDSLIAANSIHGVLEPIILGVDTENLILSNNLLDGSVNDQGTNNVLN